MNHLINAKLHIMPECPECGGKPGEPCVTFFGSFIACAPHRVRELMYRGELIVLRMSEALGKSGVDRFVKLRDAAEDAFTRKVGRNEESVTAKKRLKRELKAEAKRRAG